MSEADKTSRRLRRPVVVASSRTAVLHNPDLLALVFANLFPEDPTSLSRREMIQGRKQLRDLALTCKSFKEPALERLWICLDSLLPLIKVLPNLSLVNTAYYFHGTITDNSAICRYASRVRTLDLRPTTPPKMFALLPALPTISPHTYLLLSKELEGKEFFPLLRKISIRTADNPTDQFAALPLLFSRSVESVILSGPGLSNPLFMAYCFPLASQQMSSLRHLSLQNEKIDPAFFDVITQLTNLEGLSLRFPESNSGVNSDVLVQLARSLRNLISLTLDLHFTNHGLSAWTLAQSQEGLFPKLKSFHAFYRFETKLCGCFPDFLLKKTTSLTLITSSHFFSSQNHLAETVDVLSKMPTLEKLEILGPRGTGTTRHVTSILLFLRQLTLVELKVDLNETTYTCDGLIPLIDSAFTPSNRAYLRKLSVPPAGWLWGYVDLASLSHVARVGHRLEHLTTGLDSGAPGIAAILLSQWQLEPRSLSTLRYLDIRELSALDTFNAQQYNDIAQLLDLMFPRLICIRPYCDSDLDEPYWTGHWWFIEHLRKMYKELRLYRPQH